MANTLPKHLAERARSEVRRETDLREVREAAVRWRDLSLRKQELQEELTETNIALSELEFTTLPTLMEEVGLKKMTIDAVGNYPAFDLEAKPYYHANIAAEWEPERREKAFAALDEVGAGDLIRTDIVVSVGRKERAMAKKIVALLKKAKVEPTVKLSVHFATLTSWLREQIEKADAESRQKQRVVQPRIPPLETIGARVGKIAKLKIKEPE